MTREFDWLGLVVVSFMVSVLVVLFGAILLVETHDQNEKDAVQQCIDNISDQVDNTEFYYQMQECYLGIHP